MNITIHVLKLGSTNPEAFEIAEELLVADLIKQIVNEQHEQVDLFQNGCTEPHQRHHSAKESGIKHGDHLHIKHREVHVHMDEQRFVSPKVTTGAVLYDLWKVPNEQQLYRDARGDKNDEPVFRDSEIFILGDQDHFHISDKVFSGYHIIVNTEPKTVHRRLLSFDYIVELSGEPRPTGADPDVTVGYEDAAERNPEGTLSPGHFVKVKNGTILHVAPTNRS